MIKYRQSMNLWANFENNHLPNEALVRRRTRRITERTVLFTLRNWLLNEYVAAYCRSLAATRIFRRCYWIDALGIETAEGLISLEAEKSAEVRVRKGRKKEQGQALPPALQPVAELSQRLLQDGYPITLHGLLLAAGSSKRKDQKLMHSSSPSPGMVLPKESSILQESWLAVASPLLKEIEQVPGIFLLNPFGATMFSQADLTLIHQRSVPTELCLFISHKQVEMHLQTAHSSLAEASVLTGLLRTDRWKMLSIQAEERSKSVYALIELFTAAMKRHFLLPVQKIALPVQTQLATVETMPYTLIFATRRQDSLFCMNDAVCTYQRRVQEQSHQGVLAEEWFAQQQRERAQEEREQLSARLLQQGRAQRVRRWPDLRQQLLLANFGKFLLREYDSIMQKLIADGLVQCQWRHYRGAIGEERIPGQEDTLIWS